eukprot:gene3593-4116_t
MAKRSGSDEILVSILTLATCPWQLSSEKVKAKFIDTLNALKHNYIYPVVHAEVAGSNDKIFVFRVFCYKGSLKDIICKSKPSNVYDSKYIYSTKKTYSSGVPVKSVPRYGRQMLEALIYLKQRGITFTHLHAGNVIVANDSCYLTDIENCLTGFKPLYHDIIQGKANPEVLCFGHVLFEMVTGFPLGDQQITLFASVIPEKTMEVLRLIFPVAGSAATTPTLEEVVKHPYFQVTIDPIVDGKLKKSELAFIKEYSNRLDQYISPRGPSVLKKQQSSTSVLETSSASTFNPPTLTSSNSVSAITLPADKRKSLNFQSSPDVFKSTQVSQPPPPPKAPVSPPPPPKSVDLPKAPAGRASLLDSIRNADNIKKLKKTTTKTSKPLVGKKK